MQRRTQDIAGMSGAGKDKPDLVFAAISCSAVWVLEEDQRDESRAANWAGSCARPGS